MTDEWNEFNRIKKSRKIHRCEITQELIPAGSSCWRFVGIFEGDFQGWYCCDRAKEYMDNRPSSELSYYCSEIGEEMWELEREPAKT